MILVNPIISKCLVNTDVISKHWLKLLANRFVSTTNRNFTNNSLIYNLNNYKSSFPEDFTINEDITKYINLNKHRLETQLLKIGVIYANEETRTNSKLIEALMADPLASGNEIWFDKIVKRKSLGTFVYNETVEVDEESGEFRLPSPILSGNYRNKFQQQIESANDLIIEEVSDIANTSDYVFLINVSNELKNTDYCKDVENRILLNVLDNCEFTPHSSESTPVTFASGSHSHLIKINSQLAYNGISEFISKDVLATDTFINSMTNSNIYELYKAINWFSQTQVLQQWLLHNIKFKIKQRISTAAAPEEINDISNMEIARFTDLVNTELQDEFKPKTTSFFRKNLIWWKLYYKNDNVEYDIKDFFMNHFMNKSIENYNYLKGKISLGEADVIDNPLLKLKNKVINKGVAEEIQPFVYRALATAFLYYQFPISLISFCGYQYFGYGANECVALATLGLVLGFNQVSKVWTNFTDRWLNNLFEEIRICLGKECIEDGLLKQSNLQLDKDIKITLLRQEIFNEINKDPIDGTNKNK